MVKALNVMTGNIIAFKVGDIFNNLSLRGPVLGFQSIYSIKRSRFILIKITEQNNIAPKINSLAWFVCWLNLKFSEVESNNM